MQITSDFAAFVVFTVLELAALLDFTDFETAFPAAAIFFIVSVNLDAPLLEALVFVVLDAFSEGVLDFFTVVAIYSFPLFTSPY